MREGAARSGDSAIERLGGRLERAGRRGTTAREMYDYTVRLERQQGR
jgi:hypothetical protein